MEDVPEKSYDPSDSTLKFVKRKDEITGINSIWLKIKLAVCTEENQVTDNTTSLWEAFFMVNSNVRVWQLTAELVFFRLYWSEFESKFSISGDDTPDVLRVEMSCGHAVDPNSLTAWCRSLMDQGHFIFHCPAEMEGTEEKCNKQWSYVEVRRHALLTDEEQQYFEKKIAILAAQQYCECKWCPGCGTCVERNNLTNLCVLCTICLREKGKCYQFCWQCMKEWKGLAPRSDRCDNVGCTNIQLETLQNCDTKTLPFSNIPNCPKIRACPTCGVLIEHKEMCKYVICTRCHIEFCFACLQAKRICSITSGYSRACTVAPRQTRIPVWSRSSDSKRSDSSNSSSTDSSSECIII